MQTSLWQGSFLKRRRIVFVFILSSMTVPEIGLSIITLLSVMCRQTKSQLCFCVSRHMSNTMDISWRFDLTSWATERHNWIFRRTLTMTADGYFNFFLFVRCSVGKGGKTEKTWSPAKSASDWIVINIQPGTQDIFYSLVTFTLFFPHWCKGVCLPQLNPKTFSDSQTTRLKEGIEHGYGDRRN